MALKEYIILLLPMLVSFLVTYALLPIWINKCKKTGMLWEDMNKLKHPKNVAASGGIIVIAGFIIGLLTYLAFRTIFRTDIQTNLQIFAGLSTILILAIVGLTDDLLGWKHGGLSKKARIILAFAASIPLVVINAGSSSVVIPFLGAVNFGLVYPLILIPIAIAGTSTTFNFLAGFNGLEAGQGIIILSFLSYVSYAHNKLWLAMMGLVFVASLIAFYLYNKVPAKVFPGDILTYSVGAMIGVMAILGNFERIALFVFIPIILEVILKARGKLKKQSFGIPQKDNSLIMPYPKVYGLTHLSILILSKFKSKVYEKDVTYLIFTFQLLICILATILFI
ncbi:MAG: glycosyl transferase family 4 [Nanoarchaeota archaeon]